MSGRNCCDQVLSLTKFIENGYQKKLKAAAAYYTVSKEGLLLKLYELGPCKSVNGLANLTCDILFQANRV